MRRMQDVLPIVAYTEGFALESQQAERPENQT